MAEKVRNSALKSRNSGGSVLIIGAGVSGLSVGCYLQMNGFDTEIFEMHNQPGGVCTAWKRGGYTFDGCIHWLMGSGPSANMHQVWRELHAVQGRRFVEWDEYIRVRLASGQTFTIYTDPQKLEKEMLRLAPEDGKLIGQLCAAIRRFSTVDMPVTTEKMGLFERLGYLLPWITLGPAMKTWGAMNVQGFCSRLKSRALAEALGTLFGGESGMPDFPMTGLVMMLAFMHKKSSGYPIGGSLEFARAIARRYLELGGRIRYKARVEKILVEEDKAVGILSGGQEHRADEVISCADGHATLYDMLGGRYLAPALRTAYETYPVFPSLIYVGLGIGKNLRDQPAATVFPLKKPIVLENGALSLHRLGVRLFHFDPTMAPEGKTSAIVMIESRNLAFWSGLRGRDPQRYQEEKRKVGELVVEALEEEFGGIRSAVEVVDVATPATWHRYTGNWQGSFEGFLPTRKTMMKNLGFTLPGLANFYMHGQWVAVGGGLPPAGMNGRTLAKILCKKHGKRFSATE
jgi:phytoene dehydrogenase-like protein